MASLAISHLLLLALSTVSHYVTFGAGTVVQRAPGVLLPVCSCVEVLGLSMDKEGTRRLIKVALKAAASRYAWQVGVLANAQHSPQHLQPAPAAVSRPLRLHTQHDEETSCQGPCAAMLHVAAADLARMSFSSPTESPLVLPCGSLQVRRDACQALAVLAASLQFRTLPPLDSPQPAAGQPELVLTPAVLVLIAQKPSVMQVRLLGKPVVLACKYAHTSAQHGGSHLRLL